MGPRRGQVDLLKFKQSICVAKKGNLSHFECDVVVGNKMNEYRGDLRLAVELFVEVVPDVEEELDLEAFPIEIQLL